MWPTFAGPWLCAEPAAGGGASKQVSVRLCGSPQECVCRRLPEEDTCEAVTAAREGRLRCSHDRWPRPTPRKALELSWLFSVVLKWVQPWNPHTEQSLGVNRPFGRGIAWEGLGVSPRGQHTPAQRSPVLFICSLLWTSGSFIVLMNDSATNIHLLGFVWAYALLLLSIYT